MRSRPQTVPALMILVLVIAGFSVLLWRNASNRATISVAELPTQVVVTQGSNPLSVLLGSGQSTALPTVAIPSAAATQAATVTIAMGSTSVNASDLANSTSDIIAQGLTATLPAATPTLAEEEAPATPLLVTRAPVAFEPPPLVPPLSRDPLGRDHYWLMRPIDSNARNSILSVYSYGSNGNDATNPLRIHHGVDMPNPVGEIVRAAGSGTVIWSADGRQTETDIFQNSPSYGNVIVIEHDFGYNGKRIWTLYAHLSASFVVPGQIVLPGEPIGQVGQTGRVTGPHVHFEVRIGQSAEDNRYGNTYNPILWMVPYVGHGVIAGRVLNQDGELAQDVEITIRNFATGLVETTTTSYVSANNGFDVNSDPIWDENFVVPDLPEGKYNVITTINGERMVRQISVVEGTTAFVELVPEALATPTSDGG